MTNTGNGTATGVTATLTIVSGPAHLVSGANPQPLGNLAPSGGFAIATWTLHCDDVGDVVLRVEPNGTDAQTGKDLRTGFATPNVEDDEITVHQTTISTLEILKFNDLNKNGIRDPGEEGLEGWHFTVSRLGITVFEGYTGSDGKLIYSPVIPPGLYRVTETTQEGWQSTTPTSVLVTVPDGGIATVEFGNRRERQEIPPAVPTMGQWGMIAMATLLAGSMVWVVRKRQISSGLPKAK